MKLSRVERWILSNQFAILVKLYPDEADSYDQMREIVEKGYELHYDWISEHIYEDNYIMTSEECTEVLDILDMFRALKYAYEELTDKSDVDDLWVRFHGFDGNTETKYLGYARFLIDREGRFTNLDRGDNLNSHMPVLDIYRRMVQKWRKSKDPQKLTKEDIARITPSRTET